MSAFAAVWWVVGVSLSGHASALLYSVALLATATIILIVSRTVEATPPSPEEHARRGRIVGLASGAEALAMFLAINVLANTRHGDLATPVVAIIVGLHCLPLAHRLPAPLYYLIAAALVGLGMVGVVIADVNQRILTVSTGAAGVLWATASLSWPSELDGGNRSASDAHQNGGDSSRRRRDWFITATINILCRLDAVSHPFDQDGVAKFVRSISMGLQGLCHPADRGVIEKRAQELVVAGIRFVCS
jgi:hypothetical protein